MVTYFEKKRMTKSLHILVVDDEPDVVEIITYNLLKANYTVQRAYNGQQCLEVARIRKPDLIIMDIRMPVMNGIEACRELRKNVELNNIPVLFLTADSDEYTTISAFDAGGNHFITKPIRPSLLILLIQEIVSEKKI